MAQGTLLTVMADGKGVGGNGYIFMYGWVLLLPT